MAGLTSTFIFNPLPFRTRQPFFSLSSSSLFGLRLHQSTTFFSLNTRTTTSTSISARQGGGGGGRRSKPSKPSKPSRTKEEEQEEVFVDVSSIRSENVRLIDEEQNMVGIVSKFQALEMAEDADLDLVVLDQAADPPVVRMMDYNKYRYEQQKKKKAQQKKNTVMDLKELKMGLYIDVHDYSVRLRAAQKFLRSGHKVKVIVNLKNREMEYKNNGVELLRRFQNDIGELAVEEAKNFSDNNLFIVLVPNKAVAQRAQEQERKKKEKTANEVSANV